MHEPFYGIEAAQISPAKLAKLSAAVIDTFRSRNNCHNVDRFYATTKAKQDLDPCAQLLARRVMQIRRMCCKKEDAKRRLKETLLRYANKHKVGATWPAWYYHKAAGHETEDFQFPPEQPHPATKEHDPNWDLSVKAVGPVGLLIASVLWNGLKIVKHFKI